MNLLEAYLQKESGEYFSLYENVRQAAQNIWHETRLGWYTDHGAGHSSRIVDLLNQLCGSALRQGAPDCPNNVVALNGKANLLAKQGRPAEAITLYQGISGSIADQYTRCGLAFLLLQRNSGAEDIAAALGLFAEAERREPLNLVALLGLWISHARLGNAEEAELFRRRFEACQAAQAQGGTLLSAAGIAEKEAERQLEEIKCLITVWEIAHQAQYQRVIDQAVPYALLHMSVRQQQHAFSFC